jgi:7-carboxy-7-deazaguanine synthase
LIGRPEDKIDPNMAQETIKINEIFYSIQGESSLMGWPTVFVRTSGCPLRCTYCDTTYAYYEGDFMSLEAVIERVRSFGARHVCVTGGEPLIQKSSFTLMKHLCDEGFFVSCETSGAKNCLSLDPRVRIILDIKTPSSGEMNSFDFENLKLEGARTEIKFVVCNEEDFKWAEAFCKRHSLFDKYQVLFSPSFQELKPEQLAHWLLSSHSPARMQIQLHKYIWEPHRRGV